MALSDPEPTTCGGHFALEAEIPRLRGYLRRLTTRRDEVEDVLQETLARALRYRGSFDPAGSLTGWLRRTALRVFLDLRRQAERAPRPLGGEDARIPAPRQGDAAGGEDLDRALARLTDVERDVISRFHTRGESIVEIAHGLAMPEGTVKSHLHRARHRLGQALSRGDER